MHCEIVLFGFTVYYGRSLAASYWTHVAVWYSVGAIEEIWILNIQGGSHDSDMMDRWTTRFRNLCIFSSYFFWLDREEKDNLLRNYFFRLGKINFDHHDQWSDNVALGALEWLNA